MSVTIMGFSLELQMPKQMWILFYLFMALFVIILNPLSEIFQNFHSISHPAGY